MVDIKEKNDSRIQYGPKHRDTQYIVLSWRAMIFSYIDEMRARNAL